MFRALELFGFKTFASRTRFEFQGEVTAVIGPNGSGKSNLADAVRWVLTEPAGRGLRVRKAEDLIFLGGGGRAPAGFAEATIVLDNRNRSLPLEFDEVTVTRRLHRSGDSEYWLNGSRVRQREIIEALSRAGIAQSSYSVIGQGMIDAALSLRPEERRELIEEAADVRRHQLSLSDAQNKLAATRTNLQRLDDILAELGPRVERLRQQAAEAAEHRRLAAELSGLLSGAYVVRWKQTVERMRSAAERVRKASLAVTAVRDQQQAAAEAVTAARQEAAGIRQRHEQIVNGLRAAEAAADRARHESAYAIRTVDRLAEDLERLTAEAIEHRQRAATEAAALLEAERQRDSIQTAIATLSAARNQQHAGQLELVQAAKAATSRLADLQRAISRTEAEAGSAALMAERLAEELAARDGAPEPKAEDTAEAAQVTLELRGAAEAGARLERQVAETAEQRTAAQARQTALEERQAARKIEAAGVAERSREIERRLTALANEDAAGDGLFPAVRLVLERAGRMTAAGAGRRGSVAERPALQGIIGTVAELIETPAGYERAFEAALGGRSQDIVVERWADAEMAIRLLRESGVGRATFLPLDTVQPGRLAVWPREPGVHGLASDLCTVDLRYRPVVERLLGNWIIVDDLDVARRCLRGNGRGQQFATLQGDTVSSWGAVTGGSNPARRDGLWRRRAERTALSGERSALLARQAELAAELDRLAEEVNQARRSAAVLTAELAEREHERAAAARMIGQLQARLDRAEAAEAERQQAAERAKAQRTALERQIAELAERHKALDQRLAQERQAVAEAAIHAEEAGQRAADARGGDTELASRLAGLQASAQAADTALKRARDTQQREEELASRAAAREKEIAEQLAGARAEAKHHHQAAGRHLERAGALQQEAREVSEQLREAEARLVRLTEEHGEVDLSMYPRRPRLGQRLQVIMNHICPCVNLQSRAWLARGGARP